MFPKFVFFHLAEELFVQHTISSSENKTKQKQNNHEQQDSEMYSIVLAPVATVRHL